MLWSIPMTAAKPTGETPFFLVYGAEAVFPHEARRRSARVLAFDEARQDAMRGMDLVLGEECRREASLRAARYQQALQRYHCCSVRSRTLEVGDLVLRRVLSREGLHKLSPVWEGPFRVAHVSRRAAPGLYTWTTLNGPSHMGESFCSPSLDRTRLRTRSPTSSVLEWTLRQWYRHTTAGILPSAV